MGIKGVILVGGPHKGTRFRPLSLDMPKPLFPVAGHPIVYHHVETLSKIIGMKEIILLGFYQQNRALNKFLTQINKDSSIPVRYLHEYAPLGTAGGIYHFRDLIFSGDTDTLVVTHSDVCCDFALEKILAFHKKNVENGGMITITCTEAIRSESIHYGCVVDDAETHQLLHYVEKPETFVSNSINCGTYILSSNILPVIGEIQKSHINSCVDGFPSQAVSIEKEILPRLAGTGQAYIYMTKGFWSQIKSAGAAIYANRHVLEMYHRTHPSWLATPHTMGHNLSHTQLAQVNGDDSTAALPKITGDVYVHPSARVHPTAHLGPNVSICKNAVIGAGCRIRESIVLDGATLADNCCIINAIIGWSSSVGVWSRIEGTPNDPNPNKPYAKLETVPLFSDDGRLNPSITLIGANVTVGPEIIVLNSIVLPDKELYSDCKNRIVL